MQTKYTKLSVDSKDRSPKAGYESADEPWVRSMRTKFTKQSVDSKDKSPKAGYESVDESSVRGMRTKFTKRSVDYRSPKAGYESSDGPSDSDDVALTLWSPFSTSMGRRMRPCNTLHNSKSWLHWNNLKTELGCVSSKITENGGVISISNTNPDVRFISSKHSGKYKTFRVLYVPDPSREKVNHPGGDLGWISRNITLDQYSEIKHLKKACFVEEPQPKDMPKDEIRVEIMEWLWTMICMSQHMEGDIQSFNISYMNWMDFKSIVCSPLQHLEGWNLLSSMDCIIGGLDYTIGVSIVDRRNYGLNLLELRIFESNMRLLGTDVAFWPPIPQVQMAGYKQETITFLDEIATAHGWKRPYTRILHHDEPIPENAVLKRSHSECGSHVLLPEESIPVDAVDAAARKRALSFRRTWDSIKRLTTSMDQSWMCQDYIPTLLKHGEWRFFLIGEGIVNVVHTLKDMETDSNAWEGEPVTSFYTKGEIRDIWAKLKQGEIQIKDETFVNPPREDYALRVQGTAEIYDFVGTVFRELVRKEGRPGGLCNSMSVFCRIDIGLMFDEAGEPSYFVNEIERTATASLWLRALTERDQSVIIKKFAGAFHSYLSLTPASEE